ncbi:TH1 protein [Cryptosporidium felis]|nr:TH1 protein [Cryptosporidium felis]
MNFPEKSKLFGDAVSREEFEIAIKNICTFDSIMDEGIEEDIQTYISYKLAIEKHDQTENAHSFQDHQQDIVFNVQKFVTDCLNLIIQNYVGFAPMCQVLSDWISILDGTPDMVDEKNNLCINQSFSIRSNLNSKKKARVQNIDNIEKKNSKISDKMVEPMAILIEKYFDAETLRRYMDNNRDLLGQGGWQPPPCYWSLMKHPAIVNTIQKLFTRNRNSEFLLAFLQDLHNFSKINPNLDCIPKSTGFSSTGNFSVFTKNVTELLADFLLTDETIEAALQGVNLLPISGTINNPLFSLDKRDNLSEYCTSNIIRDICSTFSQSENAYFYAQALLHYIIVWRGDYSGCRRLSQMLYHYVRIALHEPRVAQLNLLFTNLTNFPELFKLCRSIFKMDISSDVQNGSASGGLGGFESAVKFPMSPTQISTLYDMLNSIVERFESMQMLLYERERNKKSHLKILDSEKNHDDSINRKKTLEMTVSSKIDSSINTDKWASLGSLQFSLRDLEQKILSDDVTSDCELKVGHFPKNDIFLTESLGGYKKKVNNSSNNSHSNFITSQKIDTRNPNVEINSYNETIFDMPSVSRMGDIPGTDEIRRLKVGPERPPMDALRESALLDTLIDIIVSQNIWLTPEEQNKTIDLLLLLTVYSPYELLLFLEEQKELNIVSKDFDNKINDSSNDIWSNSDEEIEYDEIIKRNVDTLSDFVSSESSGSFNESSSRSNHSINEKNPAWLSDNIEHFPTISNRDSSYLLFEKRKQADSIVGCKSTIDSCIYRNAHTQKILGSIQLLPKNKVKKMREQFQSLRDLCDRFKNRARKELFRIYNIIHDSLIKGELKWAYLDQLITTPIGASTVLRYIETFLFSKDNGYGPLFLLSSSIIVVIKHIAQWHSKKRICIFHLLRLCLEHDLHDQNSNNLRLGGSLVSTKSEKRRWIIDFFVYLIGGGLHGAVLVYMSKVGIRYLDKTLIRDFTIKLSEFCGPPYSVDFSVSYLEFLVNAHTFGALDLNTFCDKGTLSSSNNKIKISMIEIVTILDYLESTYSSKGKLEIRRNSLSGINETNIYIKYDLNKIVCKCRILKQILRKSIMDKN